MRWLFSIALAGWSIGCYGPAAPSGAPCGPNGECPGGQACVLGTCGGSATSDAPIVIDTTMGSDDAPPSDGAIDMANGPCAGGDGVCLVSCVEMDPDCVTTCGDGRCVGNADELCGNCTADCATLTNVCGNGQCSPGEAPDCYADCGPTPWSWTDDEQALVAGINMRRTDGVACPNMVTTTAPALTHDASFDGQVHEWAWEIAHHDVFIMGGGSCNGRSSADRRMPVDFEAHVQSRGYPSVQAVLAGWFASDTICPLLMNPARTRIGAGMAVDTARSAVVVLE